MNAETISRPKSLPTRTACHAHQRADQAVVYSGRILRAQEMLSHSYNLGIVLHNLSKKSRSTTVWPEVPAFSGASRAPLFWADWPGLDDASGSKLQHVISHLKHSHICRDLVARSLQDRLNWVKEWRQMTDTDGLKVVKLATSLFGDLSIPYRGVCFLTLLIKFKATSEQDHPMLLRLSLGEDPEQRTRDCSYCHSAIMLLDFVDRTGAVKINVSLTPSAFRRLFSTSEEYLKVFNVKTTTKRAQWSDLTYLHQGWSLFYACGRRPHQPHSVWDSYSSLVRESDVWEPNADSEQDTQFEPYPADKFWRVEEVFREGITLRQAKWVEESSDLDVDSEFNPCPNDNTEVDYFDPSPSDDN